MQSVIAPSVVDARTCVYAMHTCGVFVYGVYKYTRRLRVLRCEYVCHRFCGRALALAALLLRARCCGAAIATQRASKCSTTRCCICAQVDAALRPRDRIHSAAFARQRLLRALALQRYDGTTHQWLLRRRSVRTVTFSPCAIVHD